MKARHLILISMLSATSSVLAQDQDIIIEEALKATPPGFTDLVPRQSFAPSIKAQPMRVFEPDFSSSDTKKPVRIQDEKRQQPTTEFDSILKAHQKENDDFIRKLSKILENPQ